MGGRVRSRIAPIAQPGVVVVLRHANARAGKHRPVGALPDMLTFTHDGGNCSSRTRRRPTPGADTPFRRRRDPAGSVSIIDVRDADGDRNRGFCGVPYTAAPAHRHRHGFRARVHHSRRDGTRAFVTLQEANAMAVLDLRPTRSPASSVSAPRTSACRATRSIRSTTAPWRSSHAPAKGLYMPDGIALIQVARALAPGDGERRGFPRGRRDRSAASTLRRGRAAQSSARRQHGLVAGQSIRGRRALVLHPRADGALVYDSGSILDNEANARGIYDDSRSRDKGVEPEGVTLLDGRPHLCVRRPRAHNQGAVAVFDITSRPTSSSST